VIFRRRKCGRRHELILRLYPVGGGDEHSDGIVKLRGAEADREVRLMAHAGLVEASFDDGTEGSFTCISRISSTGQMFLRTFRNHPIPEQTD
jgi:hypothetical protein